MEISKILVDALGGLDNISELECCSTRLRVTCEDSSKISVTDIEKTGTLGIFQKDNEIQLVYGLQASRILKMVRAYMEEENDELVYSPLCGQVMSLTQVEDEVFRHKVLGDGIAILPNSNVIYAPVDGTVVSIYETKHAITFSTDTDALILVHVGLDTVSLSGKHYHIDVCEGQKVKSGQPIGCFDRQEIIGEGYSIISPILLLSDEEYELAATEKTVTQNHEIIKIKHNRRK